MLDLTNQGVYWQQWVVEVNLGENKHPLPRHLSKNDYNKIFLSKKKEKRLASLDTGEKATFTAKEGPFRSNQISPLQGTEFHYFHFHMRNLARVGLTCRCSSTTHTIPFCIWFIPVSVLWLQEIKYFQECCRNSLVMKVQLSLEIIKLRLLFSLYKCSNAHKNISSHIAVVIEFTTSIWLSVTVI